MFCNQSGHMQDHTQTCSKVKQWDLGTEEGWTRFTRKNRDENVEMDDGNKGDWRDHDTRNKRKGRCGKHKLRK